MAQPQLLPLFHTFQPHVTCLLKYHLLCKNSCSILSAQRSLTLILRTTSTKWYFTDFTMYISVLTPLKLEFNLQYWYLTMLSPEGSCDVAILACTCANFVVIPGGTTRQLQTLDISVNHLKKGYKSWLWSENLSLISSSWIKKAPASKLENGSRWFGRKY